MKILNGESSSAAFCLEPLGTRIVGLATVTPRYAGADLVY